MTEAITQVDFLGTRVYSFTISHKPTEMDKREKHKFRVSLTMEETGFMNFELKVNWAVHEKYFAYDHEEFNVLCEKNAAKGNICISSDYWVIDLHELQCGAYNFKLLYAPGVFGWKILEMYLPQGNIRKGQLKVTYSIPEPEPKEPTCHYLDTTSLYPRICDEPLSEEKCTVPN